MNDASIYNRRKSFALAAESYVDTPPWWNLEQANYNDLELLKINVLEAGQEFELGEFCKTFKDYWEVVLSNNLENRRDNIFLKNVKSSHSLDRAEFFKNISELDCRERHVLSLIHI